MKYPKECSHAGKITPEQISMQLKKLKPYKAPGPDGIPNIILTKCADLIMDRLMHIYIALIEEKLLYKPWKGFITIVLRKPGKPRYDAPKAYHPIMLVTFCPLLYFSELSPSFPLHFPYISSLHLPKPSDCEPRLLYHL